MRVEAGDLGESHSSALDTIRTVFFIIVYKFLTVVVVCGSPVQLGLCSVGPPFICKYFIR